MEMDVVVFDVPTLLALLFNDTQLNQIENLVINPWDRFGKYQSQDNQLGEVNSGQWYKTSYKNMVKDPNNNFLCPIILSSDKTTLLEMGDLHVDAIFMTTSIFNTQVRLSYCSSKYLSFKAIILTNIFILMKDKKQSMCMASNCIHST